MAIPKDLQDRLDKAAKVIPVSCRACGISNASCLQRIAEEGKACCDQCEIDDQNLHKAV